MILFSMKKIKKGGAFFKKSCIESGELMNHNLGGRYLNVNEKGKVQLLQSYTPRTWIFGNFLPYTKETSSVTKECSIQCPPGYKGENCEINIDDCNPNRCRNGGTCIDGINTFTCDCLDGWEGEFCEINSNDCAQYPCQNFGICIDGVNSYTCMLGCSLLE